ncbi:uncharacterized protein Smp_203910 [Schistosoma mansoni]|uniref:uncharacterized protein n=1 Tax=Schistosoma mansoni TaxID=6183 RepID=UPI00022DCACD|nr:uncharacterized protein Smp_203910 [Schistosoma mansoni]|eukprot:XP_018655391.1 uncharacterized protein Smp_203910 [Schistosoma mansoni]
MFLIERAKEKKSRQLNRKVTNLSKDKWFYHSTRIILPFFVYIFILLNLSLIIIIICKSKLHKTHFDIKYSFLHLRIYSS